MSRGNRMKPQKANGRRWPNPPAAVALMLAVGLLAGCQDAPRQAREPVIDPAASIQGVVVSEAIVPLAGVMLGLEPSGLQALTNDVGEFVLTDLEPGNYLLTASLDGFSNQSVAVETGDRLVQIVLRPDPLVGKFYEAYVNDAFLQTSANVGGARTNSGDGDINYSFPGRLPDLILIELVWKSTQSLGNELDLTAAVDNGSAVLPVIAHVKGPSPLAARIDAETIQAFLSPNGTLNLLIFAAESGVAAGRGGGAALNQAFRAITHMFYGYLPPEDYTFAVHGPPPPPDGP